MLKSELILENHRLSQELERLKEEREALVRDLKDARDSMALDSARLDGCVQQCDLVLSSLEEQ